ncbi:MAG TPA: hypothetical protein VKR26_08640, partial [Terriglobales bacterium]|nr:hypothetical protein [Terriglobales bacterium]
MNDAVFKRIKAVFDLTAGIVLPYAVTFKVWVALVCWIPTAFMVGIVVAFLWSYAGKYIFPPRLQLYVPPQEQTSVLG